MGTSFATGNTNYIFDDLVLDIAERLRPKTKKVVKLARKARSASATYESGWRGFVLVYTAYKEHGWIPDVDVVVEECDLALKHLGDDWSNKLEAKTRILAMKKEMLDSLKPRGSLKVQANKLSVSVKSLKVKAEKIKVSEKTFKIPLGYVVCEFCNEPYKKIVIELPGLPKSRKINQPCSICFGKHYTSQRKIDEENARRKLANDEFWAGDL